MEGQWGLPAEDPDLTKRKLAWVWDAGAHLMGRVTYEAMAAYWPSSTHASVPGMARPTDVGRAESSSGGR